MRGTIYRKARPDGSRSRWYAVIDLPKGPDGRRRQRTTTHDTKREAQAWLAQTILELRSGHAYDSTVTVGEYLRSWLAGKQALRPSTRQAYHAHVEGHLVPSVGHLRLLDLRSHHIEAMYRQIVAGNVNRERPVGPATMRRIHATLMSALNTAVRRGLIRRNPAATVELPRPGRSEPRAWTVKETQRFLTATRQDPWGLLYRVMLLTGLRRGEVVGLRWGDVVLDTATLKVRQQVVLVAGEPTVGPPKTASGVRQIALDPDTCDLLRFHSRREVLRCPPAGDGLPSERTVFANGRGEPLNPASVSGHFTRLVRQAGLPQIRLHDLRHTSASLGLASGESLLEVRRRLGHSSISVTADVYSHISPATARDAATRLAGSIQTG